ncbi:putative rrna processing protein rrp17 protein [Phaeoacremonium minimum UCRPA7]|uniref:Putative rrna processing protein rrp17 protein n=1 Tax=Phaeoacremonium minimum (strain UCR-PA7) TaxID=1286976 RepID=R8BJQ7_PHAM7|nr:putative rrna processing protein rrp17 protein [Phaeoacremonium minimum UCRPA7]EON99519.1 putative rrna processing protein rrp17 protein [Phaeoacremonium minimum UCRPA7]
MESEFLEPIFSRPRVKKSVLPPLQKKRKKDHAIEEISFDNSAREEYLTGFHKRKLQRKKYAEEQAAEKARQEKIELRKQIRDERKQAVEDHVKNVEALLKEAQVAGMGSDAESNNDEGEEEWGGFQDEAPALEPVDHEEEYIDEDRYTTVTVESVMVDRDGLHKPEQIESGNEDEEEDGKEKVSKDTESTSGKDQKKHPPKKKKKKFRYESKLDRQASDRKNKARKGRPQR